MRGLRQVITRVMRINEIQRLSYLRSLSCPAIEMPEEFPEDNNISFILDHGYVCPICKDRGYVACSLCKKGCIFCNFSGVKKCKCQPNLMIPVFNE